MAYNESDYLQLSGIQHFSFCRRQWALIHVEQQWHENVRTVEGNIMHEKAHDESSYEKRGDNITMRGLRISSSKLGVSGACDVVEFHRDPSGIPLNGEDGLWVPFPVEYKHGMKKENDADRLQLCAQVLCLEDMLCCRICRGALFYGETRRRETVEIGEELRTATEKMLKEMHEYLRRGYTPKVKTGKHCNACSLKEICFPKLLGNLSAKNYIFSKLEEER